MLRRLARSLQKLRQINRSFMLQRRYLRDEPQIVIGGGLEKPQGRIQEEKYFSNQNLDLMEKIRQKGDNFKREDQLPADRKEYKKVSNASDGPAILRETYSKNKHKNLLEEAFFLNQQTEYVSKLLKENKITNETDLKNKSQFEQLESKTDLKN